MPGLTSLGAIGVKQLRDHWRTTAYAALAALGGGMLPADLALAENRIVTDFTGSIEDASATAEAPSAADALPRREEAGAQPGPSLAYIAAPRVTVIIGAHNAVPGDPAYPIRRNVSGSALIVALSSTPQEQATGGTAMLPSRLPLSAARLTSTFGSRVHPIAGVSRRHAGIDLAAAWGSPLQATQDGVVTGAGWNGGYGLLVTVSHGGGIETRYAHLSRVSVTRGQSVKAGDTIGYVGSTGESTGPHVHYEVRVNGIAIDPLAR